MLKARKTGKRERPIATDHRLVREEERHWAAKPTRWKALAAALAALVMARALVAVLGKGLARKKGHCALMQVKVVKGVAAREESNKVVANKAVEQVGVQLVIATDHRLVREEERHWAAKPTRWKALAAAPAALVMARALVAVLGKGLVRGGIRPSQRQLLSQHPSR